MKPKYIMFTDKLHLTVINKVPIIARLFGKKFVGIYGNSMTWGIKYRTTVYVLGESATHANFFELPSGYKTKHILANSF